MVNNATSFRDDRQQLRNLRGLLGLRCPVLQDSGVQEDGHVPVSSSQVKVLGFTQERIQELAIV